jgi:hypothetical protein
MEGARGGHFPVIGDVRPRLLEIKPLVFSLPQQFPSLLLMDQSLILDQSN